MSPTKQHDVSRQLIDIVYINQLMRMRGKCMLRYMLKRRAELSIHRHVLVWSI